MRQEDVEAEACLLQVFEGYGGGLNLAAVVRLSGLSVYRARAALQRLEARGLLLCRRNQKREQPGGPFYIWHLAARRIGPASPGLERPPEASPIGPDPGTFTDAGPWRLRELEPVETTAGAVARRLALELRGRKGSVLDLGAHDARDLLDLARAIAHALALGPDGRALGEIA